MGVTLVGGEKEDPLDRFVDGAGLVAVSGHPHAAELATMGLKALTHRGQFGAGLCTSDGGALHPVTGEGALDRVLPPETLRDLPGTRAIGLVWGQRQHRSSGATRPTGAMSSPSGGFALGRTRSVDAPRPTTGPDLGRGAVSSVAVAMTGRFTNGARLRRELLQAGAVLRSTSDSELLLHLVAHSGQRTLVNRLVDALWKVEGGYALALLTEDRLVAVRDPAGIRPLVLGRVGDGVVLASEETAVRLVGGQPRRVVRPGEMVVFEGGGLQGLRPFPPAEERACLQELVALARDDAWVHEREVYRVRHALGVRLANDAPCGAADVVIAAPGAQAQAQGFATGARRTFVQASVACGVPEAAPASVFSVATTWRPVPAAVEGRSVCLVAASLVTGDDLKEAIRLLRGAGAQEIHLRVASPRPHSACPFGVHAPAVPGPTAEASWVEALGIYSARFLTLEALREVALRAADLPVGLCDACFRDAADGRPEESDDQLPLF